MSSRGNRAGPLYDLPTTMAKLMALGFTSNRVIEMATANAAFATHGFFARLSF